MNRWELLDDLLRRRTALLGLCLIAGIVMLAAVGPYLAPYDPLVPAPLDRLQAPSLKHLFGTDSLGRDILSRVVHGSRISLMIGFISVTISLVPGTVLGLLAGYFGDPLDSLIMRVMDVLLAFPAVLLAIVITAILGPSLPSSTFLTMPALSAPTFCPSNNSFMCKPFDISGEAMSAYFSSISCPTPSPPSSCMPLLAWEPPCFRRRLWGFSVWGPSPHSPNGAPC